VNELLWDKCVSDSYKRRWISRAKGTLISASIQGSALGPGLNVERFYLTVNTKLEMRWMIHTAIRFIDPCEGHGARDRVNSPL
jgi:hypothetical protein